MYFHASLERTSSRGKIYRQRAHNNTVSYFMFVSLLASTLAMVPALAVWWVWITKWKYWVLRCWWIWTVLETGFRQRNVFEEEGEGKKQVWRPLGKKSSVWPLRIDLQTEKATLFPVALSTRISFSSLGPHLLKHQRHGPQWATYCEHWADLLAEVTQGVCERQTGRRSTVSSKIWDQVNQS